MCDKIDIQNLTDEQMLKLVDDNVIRIRKITPRESFRFMGVKEENIDKILNTEISKTQAYKLSGNSIVIQPLFRIFEEMFYGKGTNNKLF